MRLSYRGVNHEDARSTLEVTENEISNLCRGQNQHLRYSRHIPNPLQTHDRKVCGVAYRSVHPSVPVPRVNYQSNTTVSCRKWSTHDRREALDEFMSSHLNNIRRSLEHRLMVAKAKGDDNLVQLLEAESKQMALTLQ